MYACMAREGPGFSQPQSDLQRVQRAAEAMQRTANDPHKLRLAV